MLIIKPNPMSNMSAKEELQRKEAIRVFVSNKLGSRVYQQTPKIDPYEIAEWVEEYAQQQHGEKFKYWDDRQTTRSHQALSKKEQSYY